MKVMFYILSVLLLIGSVANLMPVPPPNYTKAALLFAAGVLLFFAGRWAALERKS